MLTIRNLKMKHMVDEGGRGVAGEERDSEQICNRNSLPLSFRILAWKAYQSTY